MIVLNPFFDLLYFVCLGLDVVLFFLSVHVLLSWRRIRWLIPLGQIGEPLVEALIRSADVQLKQRCRLHLNRRGLICLFTILIFLAKLLLVCLLRKG